MRVANTNNARGERTPRNEEKTEADTHARGGRLLRRYTCGNGHLKCTPSYAGAARRHEPWSIDTCSRAVAKAKEEGK